MPPPDLILHIGLAKCGSTTLQRDVFRHEAGYVGTAPDLSPERNFAKRLQTCTPFRGRQTLDRRGLQRWSQDLQEFQSEQWPGIDRLILSNEVLSSANRLSDRPILGVLTALKAGGWPGRLRIVLVLRSQARLIASSYAQHSSSNPLAGQSDFEQHVARIVNSRRHRRFLDYPAYIDSLTRVVGSKNLCVMLIEETNLLSFWEQLSDFCRLDRFDPSSMVNAHDHGKNKRGLSSQRWEISPYDPEKAAIDKVDNWLNLIWPRGRMTSLRNEARALAFRNVRSRLIRSGKGRRADRRDQTISLSSATRGLIEEHCGQSNARLSQLLDRDLSRLGYYM